MTRLSALTTLTSNLRRGRFSDGWKFRVTCSTNRKIWYKYVGPSTDPVTHPTTNKCHQQQTGASLSTTLLLNYNMATLSNSASGNSNEATQVRSHKCWRFVQTQVCDLQGDEPKWQHLFACAECRKLQSLHAFC